MYESGELSASSGLTRFNHERLDELFQNPVMADPQAKYAKTLTLDLSTLAPYVSGPNSVKVATPLQELEAQNIKIDKAYLVSCTNSRRSDLAAAAKVFKDAAVANGGKIPQIPGHVKFYIAAASLPEQRAAEEQGDWQAMLAAGAQPLPSGCGPCIGLGTGLLEPDEVGISASNRNFKGRMGSPKAKAYLASPEVVAASALAGKIAGPGWYERPSEWSGIIAHDGEELREYSVDETLSNVIGKLDSIIAGGSSENPPTETPATSAASSSESLTEVLEGFPEKVSGEIVFCDADNVNTDAIYPGKCKFSLLCVWIIIGSMC
jgi:homoaconitate hydratase